MAPYGNNFTRLGTGPGTERNSMTGDNTINVLLETFQQCRRRGDWATLFLETRNGEEYATFKMKLPTSRENGSPGTTFFGSAAKNKSPSRVRRDKKRMETFITKKRLQESWSPKTPVTPSMKFQAWNTPALDKEESTTVSETTTITEKPDESEEASREDVKEIPGLDKEENTTVSETTNMPTIENPDESEASPEHVTPPWGCIENKEAWLADLKYICEEADMQKD